MLTVKKELIVVKFGSETVANQWGVDEGKLDTYARKLARLPYDLVVVSSGAVLTGRAEVNREGLEQIDDDQILAGLGSATVVDAWKEAFRKQRRLAAQVLVTDHEISDQEGEGHIFFSSLRKLINAKVVPIINTNDLLSNEELPKRLWKGENDRPASHIAQVIGAGTLMLLTEKNGLFDDDGITISEVPCIPEVHAKILQMARARSNNDDQGIYTKTLAAIEGARAGIDVHMAGADQDFEAILAGKTGTHFAAAA